jgi:hypothetical protein
MFFISKRRFNEAVNAEVAKRIESYNEAVEEKKVNEPMSKACDIDFNMIDAFSISRLSNGTTEIGHLLRDKNDKIVVKEWIVCTNNEEHLALVERFKGMHK